MEGRTTVALVGVGGYGDFYLRPLLHAKDKPLTLVAGVDPVAQKSVHIAEMRQRNIPLFASMEAMYQALTPDLVVLASPLHLHTEQACSALQHGSHVLCEKPLAATPEDAARMIDCRNQAGRVLAVGYQWAYAPGITRLKADILAGRFGKPTRFRTRVYWPRDESYYARNSWAGKLRTPDGRPVFDSPVNNACAHYVQNMLYLLGAEPTSADWPAMVTAELYRANKIENYDTAVIRCDTRRGVEMLIAVTHASARMIDPSFEFAFQNAIVTSGNGDGNRIIATLDTGEKIDYGTQPTGENIDKLWQTIDAIRTGVLPACGPEAAAAHTALMYAAQQSSQPLSFPAADIRTTGAAGQRVTSMQGLEAVLDRCYDGFQLPAELGTPWARPARPVRVDGLTRFVPLADELAV